MATKKKGSAGLTADEMQAQAEITLSRWLDVVAGRVEKYLRY